MYEIFIFILQVVISAIGGVTIERYTSIYLANRNYNKRSEILGTWNSTYEGIDEPPDTWITEQVSFSVKRGKLYFKNSNSSHNYNYSGTAKIIHRVFISGEWESIRTGANANGIAMLTVSSQGQFLYGYWVGLDKLGGRRYGKWVLARSESGLIEAKGIMSTISNNFSRGGNNV